MMDTDHIASIKTTPKVAKLKMASKPAAKGVEEMKGAKRSDKLVLSSEAKEAIALNRFVDILRQMPDVRKVRLEKEYDFASPRILSEVAKKIAESY